MNGLVIPMITQTFGSLSRTSFSLKPPNDPQDATVKQ